MADDENPQPNLFGWTMVVKKRGRGRPAHERTERNANKVMMLLGFGDADEDIANALNICVKTLYKHYFPEMAARIKARVALDAERRMLLFEQAQKGNVGALKALDAALKESDRKRIEQSLRGEAMRNHDGAAEMDEAGMPIRPAKAPKVVRTALGKKAVRAEDAAGAIEADPDLVAPAQPRLM